MYSHIKRFIDIIGSLILLIICAIPMVLIALKIKLTDSGPILFKQERIGKDKHTFYMYKFRTMKIDAPDDVPTNMFENPDKYITEFGNQLRKTSLDELPQLINIIKGDMSLVGPRPVLLNEKELIELRDEYDANSVYPGLTGWAQINGRDTLTNEQKAFLDGEYVKQRSVLFDLKCLLGTFIPVIRQTNIVEGKIETDSQNENDESQSTVTATQKKIYSNS